MQNHPLIPIRSYVRREGHMTARQQRALVELATDYCLSEPTAPLDFNALFGNTHPVVVEIGFGMGESLLMQAQNYPNQNFLGIEVYRPGVGGLLASLAAQNIQNVRVIVADAVTILSKYVPPASIQRLQLFFPDPWPKRRHHKRRIVQPEFVAQIAHCLAPNGIFHLATDWEPYAVHMLSVLNACPLLHNTAQHGLFSDKPPERSASKFERRGLRLGHGVWDLIFKKHSR